MTWRFSKSAPPTDCHRWTGFCPLHAGPSHCVNIKKSLQRGSYSFLKGLLTCYTPLCQTFFFFDADLTIRTKILHHESMPELNFHSVSLISLQNASPVGNQHSMGLLWLLSCVALVLADYESQAQLTIQLLGKPAHISWWLSWSSPRLIHNTSFKLPQPAHSPCFLCKPLRNPPPLHLHLFMC